MHRWKRLLDAVTRTLYAFDVRTQIPLWTPPPSPKEKDPLNSPRVLKAIADAVAKALEEKKEIKPPEPKPRRRVHTGL